MPQGRKGVTVALVIILLVVAISILRLSAPGPAPPPPPPSRPVPALSNPSRDGEAKPRKIGSNALGLTINNLDAADNTRLSYDELPKEFKKFADMDIVYSWVNGSVPGFRKIKARFGRKKISSRDRESDELRYSIRSILKNMPWHRGNIYVVSPGHVANWYAEHKRLTFVHQDVIVPPVERPTFNTNTIERFLFKLHPLTENFIHFNDDYFVTKPAHPWHFVSRKGAPILFYEPNVVRGGSADHKELKEKQEALWRAGVFHTNGLIEETLGKKKRWFLKHAPFSYRRSVFIKLEQDLKAKLDEVVPKKKFRDYDDYIPPFLHHAWAAESPPQGTPRAKVLVGKKTGASLYFVQNNLTHNALDFQKFKANKSRFLCLNDEYDSKKAGRQMKQFLKSLFPNPSKAELLPIDGMSRVSPLLSVLPVVAETEAPTACAMLRAIETLALPHHRGRVFLIVRGGWHFGAECALTINKRLTIVSIMPLLPVSHIVLTRDKIFGQTLRPNDFEADEHRHPVTDDVIKIYRPLPEVMGIHAETVESYHDSFPTPSVHENVPVAGAPKNEDGTEATCDCNGHGFCNNNLKKARCYCDANHAGPKCSKNIDDITFTQCNGVDAVVVCKGTRMKYDEHGDILKAQVRSVRQFMPWVRRIFTLGCDHSRTLWSTPTQRLVHLKAPAKDKPLAAVLAKMPELSEFFVRLEDGQVLMSGMAKSDYFTVEDGVIVGTQLWQHSQKEATPTFTSEALRVRPQLVPPGPKAYSRTLLALVVKAFLPLATQDAGFDLFEAYIHWGHETNFGIKEKMMACGADMSASGPPHILYKATAFPQAAFRKPSSLPTLKDELAALTQGTTPKKAAPKGWVLLRGEKTKFALSAADTAVAIAWTMGLPLTSGPWELEKHGSV